MKKKVFKNKTNKYFAIAVGKNPGIYRTWEECKKNIGQGYSKHKSFINEDDAKKYIEENKNFAPKFKEKEIKEKKEVEKVKNLNPVYVPRSNMDKELLMIKAKKSFEANKLKLEEAEKLKQRDLEILRNRNLKK